MKITQDAVAPDRRLTLADLRNFVRVTHGLAGDAHLKVRTKGLGWLRSIEVTADDVEAMRWGPPAPRPAPIPRPNPSRDSR